MKIEIKVIDVNKALKAFKKNMGKTVIMNQVLGRY